MKHFKSILPAILIAILAAVTACGDSADGGAVTTNAPQADGGQTPVTETAETPRITANLPEQDFGGAEFTFYSRFDSVWASYDILSHQSDGEQINDALYERTSYIEETYNVNLVTVDSPDTNVATYAKTFITAGDDSFDVVVANTYDAGSLSMDGLLLDLNDVGNLDLTQEWWAQSINNSLSIANRQYYATGDIFIVDNKGTRVFFFNKDIVNNLDLENPYDLVENNEWTLDKYIELCEAALSDLDGDNAYTRDKDQFGTMAQNQLGSVLYFASGNLLTSKDENDIPYAVCTTEKAISIMTGISEKISGLTTISLSEENGVTGLHPDNIAYFMDGRVLFAPEVLLHIETMRDCEVDVGILPPPKYDASQENFVCYADGWCVNVVTIPVTNTDPDTAGFLLEAMAADSLNNLTPAYFDVVLTDKYARDEQSVRMLDLILDSVVMDNANIFTWADIESVVSDAIYKGNAISSAIEKKAKALDVRIKQTIEDIEELES